MYIYVVYQLRFEVRIVTRAMCLLVVVARTSKEKHSSLWYIYILIWCRSKIANTMSILFRIFIFIAYQYFLWWVMRLWIFWNNYLQVVNKFIRILMVLIAFRYINLLNFVYVAFYKPLVTIFLLVTESENITVYIYSTKFLSSKTYYE